MNKFFETKPLVLTDELLEEIEQSSEDWEADDENRCKLGGNANYAKVSNYTPNS